MPRSAPTSTVRRPSAPPAFTLVELLVVIVIIGLIASIMFPVLGSLGRVNRLEQGVSTISSAIAAARAYATYPVANRDSVRNARYSGAAALFDTAGQIRLVRNNQDAKDSNGNNLESKSPAQNGYSDVPDREPVQLAKQIVVEGLSSPTETVSVPFAVRFNEYGQLICGKVSDNADRYVYYDWDRDGMTGGDRVNTVVGVVVYDQQDPTRRRQLLINRNTGSVMKQ